MYQYAQQYRTWTNRKSPLQDILVTQMHPLDLLLQLKHPVISTAAANRAPWYLKTYRHEPSHTLHDLSERYLPQ